MRLSQAKPAHPLKGTLAALLSVGIWSGWIVLTRHGVTSELSPPTLGLLRFSLPALVLLPLLLRSGRAYARAGWLRCLLMVFGSGAPFFLLSSSGMVLAPAAHVGVMLPGVMPLFVAVLSGFLLGERFARARLAGYALIVTGVAWLGAEGLLDLAAGQWGGHALLLLAAACWAAFTLAFRGSGLSPWQAAALSNAVSVPIILLAHLLQSGPVLPDVSWRDALLQGLGQGVLSGLIALAAYVYAVGLLGPSRASAFVSITPALTAVLAAVTLGEWPSAAAVAAVLLVGGGVALASGAISFRSKAVAELPQA